MKAAKLLLTCVVVLSSWSASAQFQKKFTVNIGVSPLLPSQDDLRADRLPYFFSNFEYGYGGNVNLLYNVSRKLSFGVTTGFAGFDSWKDPRTENQDIDKSFFHIYTFNPNIKYRFLKGKFSPFVMAGAGISVYRGQRAQTKILLEDFYPWDFEQNGVYSFVSIDNVLIREPGFKVNAKPAPFVMGAFGIEYKVSETVGLSIMACYNTSLTAGNYTLDQNLGYLSFPVGVNLSLGKSKSL